jgi:hypothetical protein
MDLLRWNLNGFCMRLPDIQALTQHHDTVMVYARYCFKMFIDLYTVSCIEFIKRDFIIALAGLFAILQSHVGLF